MRRPRAVLRILIPSVLLCGLLACDDEPTDRCTTTDECEPGETCLDGRCQAAADGDADIDGDADGDGDGDGDADGDCVEDCGDGTCIAGACCEAARSCGEVCCAEGQVCSFGGCVVIGGECVGEEDCDEGEYCEPLLGEAIESCGPVPAFSGRCLPSPPVCPEGTEPAPENPTCIAECRFTVEGTALHIEQQYQWGEFDGDRLPPNVYDVRNSPIVINLDDDDCDGRITARDIPEIVVITSPDDTDRPDGTNAVGDLVVLAVREGELVEKWRVSAVMNPWTYPAAGEIDGEPGNEIVGVSVDRRRLVAYRVSHDVPGGQLELLWESEEASGVLNMPSLADIDQDGVVEIITSRAVFDGRTGHIKYEYDSAPVGLVIASDVDGDRSHTLEVVTASQVFGLVDGAMTLLADTGIRGSHAITVDLDLDGAPEIIGMASNTHTMTIWRYDPVAPGGFEVVREGIDINGALDPEYCSPTSAGRTGGGGPPTAGDVNADGVPDIAVAGGVGYAVLDGARLMDPTITDPLELFWWHAVTIDCSSAQTGSSVFDFNGDGRVEVLYGDEHYFRIYAGETGDVLFETCNTNGTILEQPIVADVDNDGQADIVVVSNARYRSCLPDETTSTTGVRVFSSRDGDWVRTRRVWNQHAYHITNVGEDGAIPAREAPSWADPELNNYRLNRQPGSELAAVDAVVALAPKCLGGYGLFVTVRNLGEAILPPGAVARVYRGAYGVGVTPPEEDLLGEVTTLRSLYPAQAEELVLSLDDDLAREIILEGTVGAFAIVEPAENVQECREENNVGTLGRICDQVL